MHKRYLYIHFRFLETDRMTKQRPELAGKPFLLYAEERGQMLIRAVSRRLAAEGIFPGMLVADVRAIHPSVDVFAADPDADKDLLEQLAEWCLRYSPVVALDAPHGLLLDISGCPHLWGGERSYLNKITESFQQGGYAVTTAIADTIGAAWGLARFGKSETIVQPQKQYDALLSLPPKALRLEAATLQRLNKLGFQQIQQLLCIPRSNLRRRFGESLLMRLGQALGVEHESLNPIQPTPQYEERLPCLEPICTAKGIEIAIKHLLKELCEHLNNEGVGLREAVLKAYRLDGEIEKIRIGTSRVSRNEAHLFKLFELKIQDIEPALGIELFVLEATLVEEFDEAQQALWGAGTNNKTRIAELIDNIAGKVGEQAIHRYLPQEHHWPEESLSPTRSLEEEPDIDWPTMRPRPLHLFPNPVPIRVMVVLPDYPPMHFHYKGNLIRVVRANGPERIEQEWWRQTSLPRDYYCVEDDNGVRYWLFRLGLYNTVKPQWFLHGLFV